MKLEKFAKLFKLETATDESASIHSPKRNE